jgi:RNA polymerase sigma-70 factor (ECF subfamily)
MSVDTTQPSLLVRLKNPRDDAAWREFDAKYRDLILRYCNARGLQHWDAEDIRQIVLLRLSQALGGGFRYQPSMGRFRSYLGCVVRNAIWSFQSRPKASSGAVREVMNPDLIEQVAQSESLQEDQLWEEEWRHHHLRRATRQIRQTTEPRNVRIFDRLLLGAAVRDVAEEFSLSEQAVYKVKQRLRDKLREQIARQIREEDDFQRPLPHTGRS